MVKAPSKPGVPSGFCEAISARATTLVSSAVKSRVVVLKILFSGPTSTFSVCSSLGRFCSNFFARWQWHLLLP